MADILFISKATTVVGSAIGFYGVGGFGTSVTVDNYNDSTFITSSNGTVQGVAANNNKWRHANSGDVNGVGPLNLLAIPNAEVTLNLRFIHGTAVNVQNPKVRIYDRLNINNAASGVTTQVAEVIHPDTLQTQTGSGDTSWTLPAGSSVVLSLTNSPGISGTHAGLSEPASVRHDWFTPVSATPDSIGSKVNYGLFFQVEYL